MVGALLILGCGVVVWDLAPATGAQARSLVPVVMFNNSGNMGLPLALLAFGLAYFGAAVALFSIGNRLHFSLGARITSAHASTRELLLSPLMVAPLLGFASVATGVRPPDALMTGMKLMGDAMLPLILFALGVRLTARQKNAVALGLLGAFARPLIGLALAFPLAWALGLQGETRAQLILFGALPPAVMQFFAGGPLPTGTGESRRNDFIGQCAGVGVCAARVGAGFVARLMTDALALRAG